MSALSAESRLQTEARDWFSSQRGRIVELIRQYVAIDTRTPHEARAEGFLRHVLETVGYELWPAGNWSAARAHGDWSPHPRAQATNACWIAGAVGDASPARPTVIVNAHVDVVPARPPQRFEVDAGCIRGRGTCDTKANFIMALEALRWLQATGRESRYQVRFHLPCYEEIGGNGTLALIHDDAAAVMGAICLEPTDLIPYIGHRGCLTFRISIAGEPSHMGSDLSGNDAIYSAAKLVDCLHGLEAELAAEAKLRTGFAWTNRPFQVSFSSIEGGGWIGSSADRCVLIGNVGVPPWLTLADMEERIDRAIRRVPRSPLTIEPCFSSGLRNRAYVSDSLGPFEDLVTAAYGDRQRRVWTASCDARHYYNVLGLPTIIYGAGSLETAHGADEYVMMSDVERGASTMAAWLAFQ